MLGVENIKGRALSFGDGAIKFHFQIVFAGKDGFFNSTYATQGHIFGVPSVRSLMRGDGGGDPTDG